MSRFLRGAPVWVQAPVLLLLFPGILVAVAFAVMILSGASASGPLFESSADNAALAHEVSSISPWTIGLTVQLTEAAGGKLVLDRPPFETTAQQLIDLQDERLSRAVSGLPGLRTPVRTVIGAVVQAYLPGRPFVTKPIQLLSRTGALDHLQRLASTGGPGAWITDTVAAALRVRPGEVLVLQGTRPLRLRVAGIYRDLASGPIPDYWSTLSTFIQPPGEAPVPPPIALLDRQAVTSLEAARKGAVQEWWQFPLTRPLTITQGRRLAVALNKIQTDISNASTPLGEDFRFPSVTTAFPDLLNQTVNDVAALRGPVQTLSLAGRIVALVLVAAAGTYWARRRRIECRRLIASGSNPAALGLRAVAESALPAAAGAIVAWFVVVRLVRLLGPSRLIEPFALHQAARDAAWTTALGAVLFGVVAGAVARQDAQGAPSRLRQAASRLPWEVVLLALAGASFYEITTRGTTQLGSAGRAASYDQFLLLFPILFVAGAAGLAARALRRLLPPLRRATDRARAPVYLAARRLAGASRIALVLVTAAALAVGILTYAGSMGSSIRAAIQDKARAYTGSDVAVVLGAGAKVPAHPPFPVTVVSAAPELGFDLVTNTLFDVEAIDPSTFGGAAFWDRRFSAQLLSTLLARLSSSSSSVLPALEVGAAPVTSITIRQHNLPLMVVGELGTFTGQGQLASDRPLLVVDARRLPRELKLAHLNPLNLPFTDQLLIKGDPVAIHRWLARSELPIVQEVSARMVSASVTFLSITWAFGFMQALGLLVGFIALVLMLLFLQARQRTEVVSLALARRMGLATSTHRRSLALEMSGLLLAALIIGAALALAAAGLLATRTDPLPAFPPVMVLRFPARLPLLTAVALVASAWFGAAWATAQAGRANVAEVMRLAE